MHALTVPTVATPGHQGSVLGAGGGRLLPSPLVATNPPQDLVLAPLGAEARPLEQWLTTFHLATVVLDPYTNESSWILPTATRILEGLRGSDVRVNFLVTADERDTRAFLGPLVEQFLVFTDPDRVAVKALGLNELPAFVFVRVDGTVVASAEGWTWQSWRAVADAISDGDGVALAGHPAHRRSRSVPRVTGARLRPAVVSAGAALPDLPIVEILDQLRAALADHGRAVVAAPPGAGKTTVIPLALLDEPWIAGRRIVMLEPRRLATRAAARRMASTTGTAVGDLVGYQTRDERRIGPDTRIEVLTEGVLTRRLQQDPELPGVAAVIFDEVHERNLTTDLGLAFTLDAAATLRPDLRIVAMSATADTRCSPACWRSTACRRRSSRAPGARSRSTSAGCRGLATTASRRRSARPCGGPCATRRATCSCSCPASARSTASPSSSTSDRGVDVHRLAGALALEEQDQALAPSPPGRRRVVLATDIAETSLTVDGVRVVVDSGLARSPRFDPGTGMTRLMTVSISRDSAEQRAGRAGRTEPGAAYRLWSRMEHGTRPAHRAAEITQVDLAGLALELAAWGTPVEQLAFVDPPPRKPGSRPASCCTSSARVDAAGAITPLGRAMVGLPVHPRLARMVAGRPDSLSCAVAAVVEERDVMRGRRDRLPADLALRVALVCGQVRDDRADRRAVDRVRERAADIARRAGVRFDADAVDPDDAGAALLVGFPDRLAGRRRPGQFQLRNGTGAWVADDDPLATVPFVVAADLDGKRSGARIHLAGAVDAVEIAALLDGCHRGSPAGVGRRARRPRRAGRAAARRAAARRVGRPGRTWCGDDDGARRPGAGHPAGRPAVDAGDDPAAGAGGVRAVGDGRCVAGRVRRGAARRRSTTGWRRTSSGRPGGPISTASTSGSCCGRCCRGRSAPSSTSWPRRRGRCRRVARRGSTTRRSGPPCRCACRTCSA